MGERAREAQAQSGHRDDSRWSGHAHAATDLGESIAVGGSFAVVNHDQRGVGTSAAGRGLTHPDSFAVPMVVIRGRHDLQTPYEPARAYEERLRAPSKSFVMLERSGHVPMLEEPKQCLKVLPDVVRPLTRGPWEQREAGVQLGRASRLRDDRYDALPASTG